MNANELDWLFKAVMLNNKNYSAATTVRHR